MNQFKPLALLSVTDKTGIVPFAKKLIEHGFEITSTGGTSAALRKEGVSVTDVSELTGFPEMLNGRVKTLHPVIHGGILGDRRLLDHRKAMEDAGIRPIDVVCVNLYAFESTVSQPHEIEDAIESIDIGGPTMIRSAAKNCSNVAVIVDPKDYEKFIEALDQNRVPGLRISLAAKAFRHTAYYDSAISRYFSNYLNENLLEFDTLTVGYRKVQDFRYGENPHQAGSLYKDPMAPIQHQNGLPQGKQLWGKEISFNNINDAEGAWELVADLPIGSCSIIKHANPCGAAHGKDFGDSYRIARSSDPVSAFGGIAAFNGVIDASAADAMTEKGNFLEVVIGTSFTEEAVEIFKNRSGWGQNVRLISAELPISNSYLTLRTVRGGAIAQYSDEEPTGSSWEIVTDTKPTEDQLKSMEFAWKCVKHVRSNAIVVAASDRLLGVGAGQMNRVQSVRLAIEQAGENSNGAALASDAFFPFPDSIEEAAKARIAAIIQPGGSKKDPEVIEAANKFGIAMAFTGFRHFKH